MSKLQEIIDGIDWSFEGPERPGVDRAIAQAYQLGVADAAKPEGGAPLTATEFKLAAVLLDKAGDKFGNHGCSDFGLSEHVEMTDEAKRELDLPMSKWNGDPEEHDPDANHNNQTDWYLMHYLAARLRGEAP